MNRLFLLLCAFFFCAQLSAAEKDKITTVSPWLYKQLSKTEKLINRKSYLAAQQSLQKILPDVEAGSYEQATVLRSLSSVYALQGHYRKAADILKKSLALNVLPEKQQLQGMQNLGQLYMATGQYAQAINVLSPWLARNPKPDAETSALLANAYAQLKQYRKALPHIKRAIAVSRKPAESWYQLNLALLYELNEYRSAANLLTTLLVRYPDKKEYWNQLSTVYQQLKKYKQAASIKYLAYKKGILAHEKDILALANLFMLSGAPYRGGELLERSLRDNSIRNTSRNWERLANAWLQAKEFDKAIYALERASAMNSKGSLYQQLGQIHVEQENWQKAVAALKKALSKGGLKNPGLVYVLLGTSYFELKYFNQARTAFKTAKNFPKYRKTAMQWLEYIDASNH